MTKKEHEKIKKMLDQAVENYLCFRDRDDYPDKPCVRRETNCRQNVVFSLAEYLHNLGFISWEDCCQYWNKVDMVDEDVFCPFTDCGANIGGKCKYVIERHGGIDNG